MTQSHSDISYWLAAIHLSGIGPVRIRRWLNQLGNLKALFNSSASDLEAIGLTHQQIKEIQTPNWHDIEKNLAWAEKENCHLLTCIDDHYPALLRELPDHPLMLFIRGNIHLLSQPQIAIVGSRNPTPFGKEIAKQFASDLIQSGLIITSGLALGIDSASHYGALNAGGKTIAICGGGLQYIYPPSNKQLAENIIENGALVSEFPPDTTPKAKQFPMRNRLISGLSLGVFVIEAALKSGSLITAKFAAEQGREVFALPGSIQNPLSRGCHQLIRQGAKLVETTQDILEELGSLNAIVAKTPAKRPHLDAEHRHLLEQIGYEITPLDAIIIRSGLTAGKVSSMLLCLELKNHISVVPGGYIRNL